MACQVPRFKPLPLNVTFSPEIGPANSNLLNQLWTNTAQLINDTKQAEDEIIERVEIVEEAAVSGGVIPDVYLRLDTLDADVLGNVQALAILGTKVITIDGDLSSAELTLSATASDVTALQTSAASLTARIETAEGDITALATVDLAILSDSIVDLQGNIVSLETADIDIIARVDANESGLASAVLDLAANTTRIETTEGNVTNLTTVSAGLTTRIGDAETAINTLASVDLTALQQTVTDNEGNITTNQQALASIGTRLAAAEGDITQAGADFTAIANRVSTAEGEVSSLQTANTVVGNRLTTAEGDINTAQLAIATNLQSFTTLDGAVTTNSDAITSLGNRLTTSEGDVSAAELLLNNTITRVATAEGDINTNSQSIASLGTIAGNANSNASSALNLISTINTDLGVLESQASLVASTTAGGVTTIAGLKATASSGLTDLAFYGDVIRWLKADGTDGIVYNSSTNELEISGTLVGVDGTFTGTVQAATVIGSTLKTASTGLRAEMVNDGNYIFWVGDGAKNDANGLFYIKSDGTPYIRGSVFGGLRRTTENGGGTKSASAVGHFSSGNNVDINFRHLFFRSYNQSTPQSVRTFTWLLRRTGGQGGVVTLTSGSFDTVFQEELESGIYSGAEQANFTGAFVDTTTVSDQVYNYTMVVTANTPNSNNHSTTIDTSEYLD